MIGYAASTGYNTAAILKTEDGGKTWFEEGTTSSIKNASNLNGRLYLVSSDNIFSSSNTNYTLPPNHINGAKFVPIGSVINYTISPFNNQYYTWSVSEGGKILDTSPYEISIEWEEVGTHQIQVISQNKCGNAITTNFDIHVEAYPSPELVGTDTSYKFWENDIYKLRTLTTPLNKSEGILTQSVN